MCKQDSIIYVTEKCLLDTVVIQAWVLTCTTNQEDRALGPWMLLGRKCRRTHTCPVMPALPRTSLGPATQRTVETKPKGRTWEEGVCLVCVRGLVKRVTHDR